VTGEHHLEPVPRDDPDAGDGGEITGRLIRPYAMTRGRTSADVAEIDLEAQIVRSPTGPSVRREHRWEAATILGLVERPMALIEVAARAGVPIGVVRVIIADLIAEGAVVVQRPEAKTTYVSLLEKVLDGVRAL